MPVIFDHFYGDTDFDENTVAVSSTGKYIVATNDDGTFLETMTYPKLEPIQLFDQRCDTVGFYGKDRDMLALASGEVLRIVHMARMEIIAKLSIRPGSLYVPRTSTSPYIGVVSENGNVYVVDERGISYNMNWHVDPGYDILWSPIMEPMGYDWATEESANMFIKSTSDDDGSVLVSQLGLNIYAQNHNYDEKRNEVYFSTMEDPATLVRAYTHDDTIIQESAHAFNEGVVIDRVAKDSYGRPLVVSGHFGSLVETASLDGNSRLSEIITSALANPTRLTAVQCTGRTHYISWTQTPITPCITSVTGYAFEGRPRYEITTTMPEHNIVVPETSDVLTAVGPDNKKTAYRFISKFTVGTQTSDTAVVILDEEGSVAAGRYSPTVEFLYNQDCPIAIVPVDNSYRTNPKGKVVNENIVTSLDDVAHDLLDRAIARNILLIASGDLIPTAVRAIAMRKSKFERALLVDASDTDFYARTPHKIVPLLLPVHTEEDTVVSNSRISSVAVYNARDVENTMQAFLNGIW